MTETAVVFVITIEPHEGGVGGIEWRFKREDAFEFLAQLGDDLDGFGDHDTLTLYETTIPVTLSHAEITDYLYDAFVNNDVPTSAVKLATRTTGRVTRQALLRAAYGLLGDGNGNEWDDNPEYKRAIFELVADALGLGSRDENEAAIEQAIREAQ